MGNGGMGPKFRPFLIYQPTAGDEKAVMMKLCGFSFLTKCIEKSKNSKHYILYFHLELGSSSQRELKTS